MKAQVEWANEIDWDFGKLEYSAKGGVIEPFSFDKVKWRLNNRRRVVKRYKTNFNSLDEVLGGLPLGLTVFVGEAKSGKSTLAKLICTKSKVLYVIADSYADIPPLGPYGGDFVDYISFPPRNERAIPEIFGVAKELKSEIIIIDSGTKFLASTTKAVEEADVRGSLFAIANICDGKIPVIVTSEVRGASTLYPAGGQAVLHTAQMILWFYRKPIISSFVAKRYNALEGQVLYTVEVSDRFGIADAEREFQVLYNDNKSDVMLKEVRYNPAIERSNSKQKGD